MEEQLSNEVVSEPIEQVVADTSAASTDTQGEAVTEQSAAIVVDAQEADVVEARTEQIADAQSQEPVQDKKKKKKDKKPVDKPQKQKKEGKVRLYVTSLFKYFNIITLLPFALLMYAIFFSSYIVDKGEVFQKNLLWICIIMGVAAVVMIAWFVSTIKKRRVCSFDAFLLMALLICASMIAQCIIFNNFSSFDGIVIITLIATVAVLLLLTVRLIMFKPSEQHKNDDAKYTAKNKLSMYFTVIFKKYGFFIAMLCVIGALLILIITQSDVFEKFDVMATQTEKIVTMVFAGIAAILMIVGIFIRIVRGRANVIDCMPYMLYMVAGGGLIYFIMRHTYQILYIAIGSLVVGIVWLLLCQYTLLMSNYKKAEQVQSSEPLGTAENTSSTTAAEPSVATSPAMDAVEEANTQSADVQPSVEPPTDVQV